MFDVCVFAQPIPLRSATVFVCAVVRVKLNGPSLPLRYSQVEIDFSLQCRGTNDADCAVWDHCISLLVRQDQLYLDLSLGVVARGTDGCMS